MKYVMLGLLCLSASIVPEVYAGQVLPDELTVNVGDVEDVGTNVTVVLRKHSVRADNYACGVIADSGFKKLTFPVSTYRGHVKDDPHMYVNGNIEPGGILNLNFSINRQIMARVRDLKIKVPEGKATTTMSAGNTVVPLAKVRKRPARTPGGYVIPEVPMRRSKWKIHVTKTYTEQFELEKVVSQVEQRFNDGDWVFARDAGTAWEIETLILEDPKLTVAPKDRKPIFPDEPERLNSTTCLHAGLPGIPGRNHGKFGSMWITGLFHEAGIALHEGAHLYDNPWHQMGAGDGLCGGGAWWDYNDVSWLVQNRKARYNETNFPAVIYGSPLPPRATPDIANTGKDTPVTIDVLENDYDGNDDTLALKAVVPQSDKGGTCALSKDGKQVVYTPKPGFIGQDKFTYTVMDGTGLGTRSGQVKVDVRGDGLAVHYDFEQWETETIADLAKVLEPDAELLWLYGLVDKDRKRSDQLLYYFHNVGPYNKDERATAMWTEQAPIKGLCGRGVYNPGRFRMGQVRLGESGDPGYGSLSASVWVLYPTNAISGGNVILGKGGNPSAIVNGWTISGGHVGGRFTFQGNVVAVIPKEAFSLKSEEKIEANKWYHLVMILDRDKKQLRAWVNGKEVKPSPDDNVTIPDGPIEYWSPLLVFNSFCGKWWNGTRALVDEVKVFTSVLTPKQVAELYAEGKDANVPKFPELPKK